MYRMQGLGVHFVQGSGAYCVQRSGVCWVHSAGFRDVLCTLQPHIWDALRAEFKSA